MKLRLVSPVTQPCRGSMVSGKTILLATIAVAALFSATRITAQSFTGMNGLTASSDASTAKSVAPVQSPATPAVPALSANESSSLFSAPEPAVEEARLVDPLSAGMFSLADAQDPASSLTSRPAGSKAKAPHHGLGIALAITGTAALLAGAGAYAIAARGCNSYSTGACHSVHDFGIIMMPVGGAVAATGFYFQFHK